jgi:pre-rRNA-processing protein IPI1
MGASAKRKKEKKADFVKPKLRVGKARPKNTNATDTSFAAKSIVLKQQSLSEGTRDAAALFQHNLSLLSSKNETQRRDALTYLITAVTASAGNLPRPAKDVLAKAQPLILDGNPSVRSQVLKLLKALPKNQLGSLDQVLLYARTGIPHLSTDIRMTALDALDWLLEADGEAVVSIAGGWVKTLKIFQNLLSWHGSASNNVQNGHWTAAKTKTNLGSNKLLVHQLTTLARFLTAGLTQAEVDPLADAKQAAALFPLWHTDAHTLPKRSNPLGHLNLFGAPRNVESEVVGIIFCFKCAMSCR